MPTKKVASSKATTKRSPKPRVKKADLSLVETVQVLLGEAVREGLVPGGKFDGPDHAASWLMSQLAASGNGDAAEALDRAQEIAFDGWQASSAKKAAALARKALAISADCADAYNILARCEGKTPAGRLALYEAGVQAGRRGLGKEYEELRGEFWGFIETRPFMRSLEGMADSLWDLGRREESVACHREMLALNPNDNQGVRNVLLGQLLELGQLSEAEKLLTRYKKDDSAWWTYGGVLAAFLAAGASAKAEKRLEAALKSNPHVPDYLLGTKRPPKKSPDYYSPGQESEAISYAEDGAEAWSQHPAAREWLAEAMAKLEPAK